MTKTLLLSSALALLLVSGAAYAGSNNIAVIRQGNDGNSGAITQDGNQNKSKFTQDGSDNTVSVTQTGNGNTAGAHLQYNGDGLDHTETAAGYNYMSQHGSNNTLTIVQTENGNSVGIDGHVLQTGNYNSADITQHGGASAGGRVNLIEQTDATGTATALTNDLMIFQEGAADGAYGSPGSSDYHYAYETIGTVIQTNTGGAANTLSLTQSGGIHNAANVITSISQTGTDNAGTVTQTGRRNRLTSMIQSGAGNTAYVMQTGTANEVDLVEQTGGTNYAWLEFNGASNGVGSLSGYAGGLGLGQGDVQQWNNGVSLNSVTYIVSGDSNLFAFQQDGTGNSIDGTVGGASASSSNQVAVLQASSGNTANFSQTGAGSNNLAISQ